MRVSFERSFLRGRRLQVQRCGKPRAFFAQSPQPIKSVSGKEKSPLLASVCSPPPKGKTISASGNLPLTIELKMGSAERNHPFFTALATSGWKSK